MIHVRHEEAFGGIGRTTAWTLSVVLGAWFAVACGLAGADWFTAQLGQPPLALLAAVVVPVIVFAAIYAFSARFRTFVRAGDPEWLTILQSWRILGGVFLVLLSFGLLPAVFALPAGFGDVAIGLTAPFIARAFANRGPRQASRLFVIWQLLGILDLVVALSIGTLSATLASGAPGEISTAPMATLPLLLIPVYLVPLFLMLHTAALMQSRQIIRGRSQ